MSQEPFEWVVREYGAAVLRVCRAVAGPDAADDAWSETFLAALRAYPQLRPHSNVRAWLMAIARNKSIDQLRVIARRPASLESVAEPGLCEPAFEAREELHDALALLPPKQRDAVTFHYFGGLRYAEVADLLGNSESAARRAAADGMKRLRAIYREDRK